MEALNGEVIRISATSDGDCSPMSLSLAFAMVWDFSLLSSMAVRISSFGILEEQSPSEYASGKVASAEEWAARKSGRTVTSAGKTAAQTSYEKIKLRVTGKKEAQKEAARGTGDTQAPDPVSREAPKQKNREQGASRVKVKERENQEVQIQKAKRQKAISDAVKTKEQKIRTSWFSRSLTFTRDATCSRFFASVLPD